jgi:hypothetical protein
MDGANFIVAFRNGDGTPTRSTSDRNIIVFYQGALSPGYGQCLAYGEPHNRNYFSVRATLDEEWLES